ncbi:MAG: LemA family protein [Actinobacteria bacterium]|nr:LemA family protein [Actinomycetota bacterium]
MGILGGIILIVVILVVIVLIFIGLYNSIVSLRNRVDNAWSQIDVQLRKRFDLIPNLVETVKGYAAHERETLEKVIEARQLGMNASSVKDQAQADNMISGTLKSLFAVTENYPNLKADAHFTKLMEELQGIESNIAFARQFYNDMVMQFNTRVQTFPGNIFAGMFNFKIKDYFLVEESAAREPVKVQFTQQQ